jgi:hypothetical protein
MCLNVYVAQLQRIGGVVSYLRGHLGPRFASTAAVAPNTDAFAAGIERFVAAQGVQMVSFTRHQRRTTLPSRSCSSSMPTKACRTSGGRRKRPVSCAPSGAAVPPPAPRYCAWQGW